MVISDKIWHMPSSDAKLCRQLADQLQVTTTVAQLLIGRGYKDAAAAQKFLYGTLDDLLNPYLLNDMDRAVERLVQAIENEEAVCIYGDYDVDGITASSLLFLVLKELGTQVDFYIPDRKTEGYGLHAEAIEEIVRKGFRVMVTVDCGISAAREVAAAPPELSIIITDHHQPPAELPDALAVLNPKRADSTYPEQVLSGVGVVFKLCQALWGKLKPAKEAERLFEYTDLVALGTVADIVPLVGENRLLVRRGIRQMNEQPRLGIKQLLAVSQTKGAVDSRTIGFRLAPRLNASGRMAHAKAGVRLLIAAEEAEATNLAASLDQENTERQQTEQKILKAAEEWLAGRDLSQEEVLVVAGEDWHPGVIGIVASRLVERYFKPVVMISIHDGVGKGSCRSIPAFDMYEALNAVPQDILVQFGGHHQAAGLTVLEKNIEKLRTSLIQYAREHLREQDYHPVLNIDALLPLTSINDQLLSQLLALEPYGEGNRQPLFLCQGVTVEKVQAVGQDKRHLRLCVGQGRAAKQVIAFNQGALTQKMTNDDLIDLVFFPEYNEFRNVRSIQLHGFDLAGANPWRELRAMIEASESDVWQAADWSVDQKRRLEDVAPDRNCLVDVYRALRFLAPVNQPIFLSNVMIAQKIQESFGKLVRPYGVAVCLEVFSEIKLLTKQETAEGQQIVLYAPPQNKLDLHQSTLFCEGEKVRNQFCRAIQEKQNQRGV